MKKSMICRYLPRTPESFGSLDAPRSSCTWTAPDFNRHSKFVDAISFSSQDVSVSDKKMQTYDKLPGLYAQWIS